MGHEPGVLGARAAVSPDGPASPFLPPGRTQDSPSVGGRAIGRRGHPSGSRTRSEGRS